MTLTEMSEPEIGLNDRRLRLWGIPLVSLSGLLSLMQFFFQGRWDLFGKYLLISLVYTFVTWELCRWVLIRIRRRIPELDKTMRRLGLSILTFFVIAGVGNVGVKLILAYFGLRPPSMINHSFFEWWLLNMPNIVFFVLLLSSIYEAMYFFSRYKSEIQKARQLKNQQAQQNLDALKTRVNPHFLFNSLTTLSALIGEDASRAEQFVDELSKVYRYLLRAGRQATATLGEELIFAESYAFLLKNRFEPGTFSLSVADPNSPQKNSPKENYSPENYPQETPLDRPIPVLTFQNTLDYLVRTQNAPLHIRVEMLDGQLCISCDDQPKARTFDAQATDWKQLAASGAAQETGARRLTIQIPFSER